MTVSEVVVRPRRWWAHALVVLGSLLALLVGAFATVVPWLFAKTHFGCSSFDDEYSIADASVQGRYACGDSSAPDFVALACVSVLVILLLAAVVMWVRRGRLAAVVLLIVLAGLIPVVAGVTVSALPATCSDKQAAKNPDGCELP